jgi:ferritin-like metal-binding protein YciE
MSNQGSMGSSGNFPLDNLTYDLITILYEKSKALEAYDKYQRDAQGNQQISNLFQQIRSQDEQHIQMLQQHLSQLLSGQGGLNSQAVGGGSMSGGSMSGGSMGGGSMSGGSMGGGSMSGGSMGGSDMGSSDMGGSTGGTSF